MELFPSASTYPCQAPQEGARTAHLVDHILELGLRWVLPERAHDGTELLGGDCSIAICTWVPRPGPNDIETRGKVVRFMGRIGIRVCTRMRGLTI